MRQELIDHSPDLKRLRDEGYGIEEKGGLLIVHQIPFVNSKKEVHYGKMVCELSLNGTTQAGKPGTHIMYFIGEFPCDRNGNPITALKHDDRTYQIAEGVIINYSFSTKIGGGRDYNDYYEKVNNYATVISNPAKSIDEAVTEKSFKLYQSGTDNSVFEYTDTNASRANITAITEKIKGQKIAIIGTGGTGSYILDFIAKTPVAEIHLFDEDKFYVHNAFRAPGAATKVEIDEGMTKVEYLTRKFSAMHKGIIPHEYFITSETVHELSDKTFVFIAIDKGEVKSIIIKALIAARIPFIDVGMRVHVVNDSLIGIIRVTTGTSEKADHLERRISFADDDDDEYNSNIQIAELNSLNASLAVIKWKKIFGFYHDSEREYHTTYTINESQLLNDET